MKVVKYNVSKPKKYQDKQGNEKTQWNNIGTMTEFHKDDGSISRIIEIPAIGLDANIFPFTDLQNPPARATTGPQVAEQPHPVDPIPTINIDDEINPADLPF